MNIEFTKLRKIHKSGFALYIVLIQAAALQLTGCAHRTNLADTPNATPEKANSFASMAASAMERGDFAGALLFDRQAKQADPNNPAPDLNEGEIAERQSEFGRAKLLISAYLVRKPEDVQAQADLGIAELALGNPQHAHDLLGPIAAKSDDGRILRNDGVALDQLGRQDAAQALDRRALELEPTDPLLRGNLALSLAVSNQAADAEAMIETAISMSDAPPYEDANAVMILAFAGKTQIARQLGDKQFGTAATQELLSRASNARDADSNAARAKAFGVVTATIPQPTVPPQS
jgi:Flp pilus assembly protein TadD